ncbi:MAG: hypothetical protein RIQ56_431 [Candidatus Parcubacteria bacterium]|jgi:CheY-like chemotaxis protein
MDAGPRKKVVLVVEDEQQQREVLVSTLTAAGFNVIQAMNGKLGLAMALDRQPDIVLLDIRMPEMTGFEMLKRLRKTGQWGATVPVVFLTNIQMTDEAESEDVEGTQPAHYFVKSDTSLEKIVEKIKELA